jgi:hypothetical protein
MKCPNCGTENPEGKKFCGDCGAMIPQPPPPPPVEPMQPTAVQPKQSRLSSNWRGLTALIVVLVVVFAMVGLVYSQPWSKIKVIVSSEYALQIGVEVYIDWNVKATVGVDAGTTIVGVWPVETGSHVVSLDHGTWDVSHLTDQPDYYYPNSYDGPDGVMDFTFAYSVGPLYTKNVYISIVVPPY